MIKMAAPLPVDGGSSPMVKPKGDKQVEYLDLDLESGKSTPPRKVGAPHNHMFYFLGACVYLFSDRFVFSQMKNNGTGISASDERVDYVVVDQQRTQALKSTREAWNEDRVFTETDTLSKAPKWARSRPPTHLLNLQAAGPGMLSTEREPVAHLTSGPAERVSVCSRDAGHE